jgi:ribosomal protein S18 acetylase RimI-like enzyme
VEALGRATGFFSEAETAIARELVEERAARGAASGYEFLFADGEDGALDGYACFGPIPCTRESWDLYWIAVRPALQGRGLGRRLLRAAEERIAAAGGTRVYVDTSTRDAYAPTRAFYEACGYARAATLEDFYAPGDGKVIYVRCSSKRA